MKVIAVIEKGNNGGFDINMEHREDLNFGLLGQGNTVNEAVEDFLICREEMKELFIDKGEEFPDLEFEYKYDVPSLFNFFNEINITSFAKRIGLNASLLRQYKNGLAFASEKQVEKIRKGLHELGSQMCAAKV